MTPSDPLSMRQPADAVERLAAALHADDAPTRTWDELVAHAPPEVADRFRRQAQRLLDMSGLALPTTAGVRAQLTKLRVMAECITDEHPEGFHFAVYVEDRGRGSWAVTHEGNCLSVDGTWDYEPNPSNRDNEWMALHRFTFNDAYTAAVAAAATVTLMGKTAAEYAAWYANR